MLDHTSEQPGRQAEVGPRAGEIAEANLSEDTLHDGGWKTFFAIWRSITAGLGMSPPSDCRRNLSGRICRRHGVGRSITSWMAVRAGRAGWSRCGCGIDDGGVKRRGVQLGVAEQHLDDADV